MHAASRSASQSILNVEALAPAHQQPVDYWHETRQPLTSLCFLLPILAVYEGGLFWFGSSSPVSIRNGADDWLRSGLHAAGMTGAWLLPALVAGGLVTWHFTGRYRWRLWPETYAGMWAESLLLAFSLILMGQVQDLIFRHCEQGAAGTEHAVVAPHASSRPAEQSVSRRTTRASAIDPTVANAAEPLRTASRERFDRGSTERVIPHSVRRIGPAGERMTPGEQPAIKEFPSSEPDLASRNASPGSREFSPEEVLGSDREPTQPAIRFDEPVSDRTARNSGESDSAIADGTDLHASDAQRSRVRFALLVSFLGAGVYEELLFRLLLLPAAALSFQWLGGPRRMAWTLGLIISSVMFAGAHHLGANGEPWSAFVFLFRMLAGLFFGAVFLLRGFGIAVGSHAVYDLLVGLVLWPHS